MFIRVIFKIPPTGDSFRTAMIWINYVTLFPIICKREGNSYKLYSISPRPQSTDSDSSDSDSSDSGSTDSDSTDSDSQVRKCYLCVMICMYIPIYVSILVITLLAE